MNLIKKTKTILIYLFDLIARDKYSRKYFSKNKNIIIIKTDAIGDYILFRNFLESLKKSEKFKDYKITLIGNYLWKDIAEEFDKEFVDNFIWIKPKKFTKDIFYRYKTLKKIKSKNYSIAIHPTYSRNFYTGDSLIKAVNAKEKIGWNGDLNNTTKFQKKISDKFYTRLFSSNEKYLFEFYRNKEFFEKLLNKKITTKKPYFKSVGKENLIKENYFIISLGAGSKLREWSSKKFAKIANYIYEKKGWEIVLTGSENEKYLEEEFTKNLKNKEQIINLIGKIKLDELISLINNAKILIANESASTHIAAALDTKTICISNGNHFTRFNPYPKEITEKIKYIYPPEIEKELEKGNTDKIIKKYYNGSKLDINKIEFKGVVDKIKDKISNKF
jgi:ADP-heptose:LPS heptosyltransferase